MSLAAELGYVTRFFKVLRKHLEENQCTHSILEIAAEADSNAGEVILMRNNVSKENGPHPTNADMERFGPKADGKSWDI